jgi:hypothetical protein
VYVPLVLRLKNSAFCPRVFICSVCISEKKHCFLYSTRRLVSYNWGDKCLLCGTNWVIKQNSLDIVLKCFNRTPLQTAKTERLMSRKRSLYTYNLRKTRQFIPNILLTSSHKALLLYPWDQTLPPSPQKKWCFHEIGQRRRRSSQLR